MLNKQIIAWLASKDIAFAPGDYRTAQPDGQADAIISWNVDKLGVQPSQAELDAAAAAGEFGASKMAMTMQVMVMRAAKLSAGFDYNFNDTRGIHHIGTTEADEAGWDSVTKVAGALVALGQGVATISIVTDTGAATITALEWQQILVAAGQFGQPIYAHSFTLEAQIAAASSSADLDAIDISAGW